MTKSRFDKLLTSKTAKEPKEKTEATKPGAIEATETRDFTVRRAVGKRSKEDYAQITAYILKSTHKGVKAALIDDDRDFSELVEELLSQWLLDQKRG